VAENDPARLVSQPPHPIARNRFEKIRKILGV
jgi:hypothetical protein